MANATSGIDDLTAKRIDPTRPLTCVDRPPKQGDVLAFGHEREKHELYLIERWTVADGYPQALGWGYKCWGIRSDNPCSANSWRVEGAAQIMAYRYIERADGGPVDWPIDAGAYLE